MQPDVLEELFFAGLIGNVQIDSVVPYILKMENSEYQASQKEAKNNEGKILILKYFFKLRPRFFKSDFLFFFLNFRILQFLQFWIL